MPSSLSLARERLKTIAETVSGLSGKCTVLCDRDAADVECWKRYAPGSFRLLAVCESSLSPGGIDAPTAIRVYLYASDAVNAEAVDDLVAALREAWLDTGNYPGGELACLEISFEAYEPLVAEGNGVMVRVGMVCYFVEI